MHTAAGSGRSGSRRRRRWCSACAPAPGGSRAACAPGWLARLPVRQGRLAIAHERAHLDGRDPWMLAAAFGLLCALPWNPALWWMLRRLRGAIEIDCDARVLRSGCDLAEYGETLVAVGQHQSGRSWAMAAMVPSTSFLERRIQIMLSNHSSR